MATVLGSMRRLTLAPSLRSVGFAGRGFDVPRTAATRALEAIPRTVVCGFEWGIDARDLDDVVWRLDVVDPYLRGFAYEGATMAFTVRDAMGPGTGGRARELLAGPGKPHVFLNFIGIGFAMARLPRPLWRKVLPDLTGTPYYPTMSWLAVDGYGFDRAYFDTDKWVDRQFRPKPYPWQSRPDYFPRAVDQGIGRALWFIHGGQPSAVAAAVRRFSTDRQGDLWSGVGLAATFAGGCGPDGLAILRQEAGDLAPDVAQGSVFAAKARAFSGAVPDWTEPAVSTLAGLRVATASRLADDSAPDGLDTDRDPPYEIWRRRVRAHLAVTLTVGPANG